MRFLSLLALVFITPILHAAPRAEHVIIISIDGGKPAVIAESEMPQLKGLVAGGSATWVANTIFPSKTLPSHTSMLTGVSPEKHNVLWNDFSPIRGLVKVPTVFSYLKTQNPSAITAMLVGKVKFRHLWQPNSLDLFNYGTPQDPGPVAGTPELEKSKIPSQAVAKTAAAYILEKKPTLAFIHLTDPDSAGHKDGWGSPEQKEALKVTDQALSQVIRAISEAGIAATTVIIISADHGGHLKTHGDNIPDDMNIPWIASGCGVKKGYNITAPVTTYDTTATALWLLGVPLAAELDGKPVTSAFEP
jgi:predicted AlkP superfamily pyrophosphatase or phosphodiesterase